jgi:hypothetical protein
MSLSLSPTSLSALVAIAGVWVIAKVVQDRQRRAKLPPGPPGYPLIGSFFIWPKKKRWLKFAEWGQTYGMHDLHYLSLRIVLTLSLKAGSRM